MATGERSSEGTQEAFLSKLPGIPSASIKTAAELESAVRASKPLILRGLTETPPLPHSYFSSCVGDAL